MNRRRPISLRMSVLVASLALAPLGTARCETVQQFVAGFVTDFDNLDWDRFRRRFSDDSTVFFPPQYGTTLVAGREATDAAWRRTFEAIRAASKVSAPPYMRLEPHGLTIQQWPGGAVVSFTLGGGAAPMNRRTLVLRPEGDSFVIVHLHGSTLPPGP